MPTPAEPYPVALDQDVSWGDLDAFQHVNNTAYFRYFEDARMVCFERLGMPRLKADTQLGPILASTQCDFRAPLTWPERIRVATWVEDLKARRFTMRYRVFSLTHERLVAEGSALVVFYDYAKGHSCEVPTVVVERLASLQAGFTPPA